jgi:hypothetical protein
MSKGWISLHRQFSDHWMWSEKRVFSKAEAWIDILLTVNHNEQKVVIKNVIYNVNRGESIVSLDNWAKRWNWNKSKVRRFFDVLQGELMIVTKNETQTTRLTVCNYDSYQTIGNADETQTKRKRNADETQTTPNNNDNNINNENNENKIKEIDVIFNFRKSLIEYGFKENLVIDWLKVRKTKKATNTETAFKGFIKQVELSKLDINYILEECINNSWKGFKKDWLANVNLTNKTNQIDIKTNFGKTNQI